MRPRQRQPSAPTCKAGDAKADLTGVVTTPARASLQPTRRAILGGMSARLALGLGASFGLCGSGWVSAHAQSTHPPIFIMRHAMAPGYGDPAGFALDRCDTQRNLDARGREQALAIGQWLRSQAIESAEVWSSPWCRTLETARLLQLGPVHARAELASFFQFGDRDATTAQLRQALREWRLASPQQPLVLVSHQVNISALTGMGTRSAEVLALHLDAQGELKREATASVYQAP